MQKKKEKKKNIGLFFFEEKIEKWWESLLTHKFTLLWDKF